MPAFGSRKRAHAKDRNCADGVLFPLVGRAYGKPKPRFPWLLFLLLLASIYAFWILPIQLGPRKVNVEFSAFSPTGSAGSTNNASP
jgi:hypothetical protein